MENFILLEWRRRYPLPLKSSSCGSRLLFVWAAWFDGGSMFRLTENGLSKKLGRPSLECSSESSRICADWRYRSLEMQLDEVWEISSSWITFCGWSDFLKLCIASGCRMLFCTSKPLVVFCLGGLVVVLIILSYFLLVDMLCGR